MADIHGYVLRWLDAEHRAQRVKFPPQSDDTNTRAGLADDDWWWNRLVNYYGRAQVLSLETIGGRQALAKFVATATSLLESSVRVYGPLPQPGQTSGEVMTWGEPLPE